MVYTVSSTTVRDSVMPGRVRICGLFITTKSGEVSSTEINAPTQFLTRIYATLPQPNSLYWQAVRLEYALELQGVSHD
jgi:hypothetical protein